jgi:raffinose/stachyose/melibiose transport system permease protein
VRRAISGRRTLVVCLLTLPYLLPFVFLLFTSFKSNSSYSRDPLALNGFSGLISYKQAWDATDLGPELLHSLLAASVGVAVSVASSLLAGYWLYAARGLAARVITVAFLVAMAVPSTVYVIPLFVQLAQHHLVDNLLVLGTIYGAIGTPLGAFLVRSFLCQLPVSLFDAAAVDGTGTASLLGRIVLPLTLPTIGTVATLVGILGLNDLLLSSVMITSGNNTTAIVGVASLADIYSSQIPEVSAGVLIVMVPILTVFIVAQRTLQRGITAGIEH